MARRVGRREVAAVTGDTAEVAEVVRVLSFGLCSPARHAEVGCETCDAKNAAIATVRKMAAEIERLQRDLDEMEGRHASLTMAVVSRGDYR